VARKASLFRFALRATARFLAAMAAWQGVGLTLRADPCGCHTSIVRAPRCAVRELSTL